jgi:hypothetical protein
MNKFLFGTLVFLAGLSAQAQNEACINLYPKHVVAQCKRSTFVMDIGASVTSRLEVRQAMWQQNPASNQKCLLSPYSGVEIAYSIVEVSSLQRGNAAIIPEFSGLTQSNTVTFSRPLFSGVAQLAGSGSSFGTVGKSSKSIPGLHEARFTLSRYGTLLSGWITSGDGKYVGFSSDLSYECEFF